MSSEVPDIIAGYFAAVVAGDIKALVDCFTEDADHLVRTRLEGNFPGGTADLAHHITLRGGLISHLEIAP
jgi:ketosteroid isomerase-like protein